MTDPVNVNDLRAYVQRIENIEAEKRALSDDVAVQYASAKAAGFNPKAMRKLIAERRRKTDAEVEADLELYRAAIAEHGSLRKAAEALGVSKSKLHRAVPREKNGTAKVDVVTPPEVAALPTAPPHDAETGELVDDGGEPETGIPVSADVPRETDDDMPAGLRERIADAPDPGPIPAHLRRERATA